jgi:large conductance mechanosensitive channel
VIIGVAFGAIVTSLVQDIIMPIIGAVTGGLDFSDYYLALSDKVQPGVAYADAKKQGAAVGYGQFFTVAINFIIVAWVLFEAAEEWTLITCASTMILTRVTKVTCWVLSTV